MGTILFQEVKIQKSNEYCDTYCCYVVFSVAPSHLPTLEYLRADKDIVFRKAVYLILATVYVRIHLFSF